MFDTMLDPQVLKDVGTAIKWTADLILVIQRRKESERHKLEKDIEHKLSQMRQEEVVLLLRQLQHFASEMTRQIGAALRIDPADYDLDLLSQQSEHATIPIRQVLSETPEYTQPDFESPLAVYGPPNVGKTCWAIREAWRWKNSQTVRSKAFIVNAAKAHPSTIYQLACIAPETNLLFIIDDAHFVAKAMREWVSQLDRLTNDPVSRSLGVGCIWVGRDEDIIQALKEAGQETVVPYRFPVDRVLRLYLDKLPNLSEQHKIIAAFEAGLDPCIARRLESWKPTDALLRSRKGLSGFASELSKQVRKFAQDRLSRILSSVESGSEAYEAYVRLLAFGSIAYPLQLRELPSIGLYLRHLYQLNRVGLCKLDPDQVALTEHPFQIRQLLNYLRQTPEGAEGRRFLSHEFSRVTKQPSLWEAAFCNLIISNATDAEKIALVERLCNYAEWSGVRELLADGLGYLVKYSKRRFTREVSDVIWEKHLKLQRTGFPYESKTFEQDITHGIRWWKAKERLARKNEELGVGRFRLDTILYEIGYRCSLLESYDQASEYFRQSVDAALGAIVRGFRAEPGSAARKAGELALAHVWISAILERSCQIREIIRLALGGRPADQSSIEILVGGIATIHTKLSLANKASEKQCSALYLEALGELRQGWQAPSNMILRRPKEREQDFGRHELNSYLHAAEVSCWPALFGISSNRIATSLPIPSMDFSPTFPPPGQPTGIPAYRKQQVVLLSRVIEKVRSSEDDARGAIGTAALFRAAGEYQYLGDLLLLAWRTIETEEVSNAIEWYLEECIPDVGFNALPKKALAYLREQGKRKF